MPRGLDLLARPPLAIACPPAMQNHQEASSSGPKNRSVHPSTPSPQEVPMPYPKPDPPVYPFVTAEKAAATRSGITVHMVHRKGMASWSVARSVEG